MSFPGFIILIFLIYAQYSDSYYLGGNRNGRPLSSSRIFRNTYLESTANPTPITADKPIDLTGHGLWVTFTGMGVENMTFSMELMQNNKVKFGRGLTSESPGFWRTVKLLDGSNNDLFEATQPLLPEHMLFYDVTERAVLWRGEYDKASNRIIKGEVITNKKRFEIFPYTEIIATFEAEVYGPKQKLPEVRLPTTKNVQFTPPRDFYSPVDMKRYPDLFDDEFIQWWFATEV